MVAISAPYGALTCGGGSDRLSQGVPARTRQRYGSGTGSARACARHRSHLEPLESMRVTTHAGQFMELFSVQITR